MPAVAGLRGTGDWSTDERPKNFREMILWRNPNGTAPLFALCSKVKKRTVDDPEFAWWDEPNDIVRLQVLGTLGTADTTIVVNSTDPSAANPGNRWGTATNLKAGDILMVEPAVDNATFNPECLEVVSIESATNFVVKRGASGTTAAAILTTGFLLKIGSAYGEGTSAPRATSRNPVKYKNYIQIFKDTYEVTGTAANTFARTGDPVKNDKKRKAFDQARDIEMAMLFGQPFETTDDNGKPKRFMGGLRSFINSATTTMLTNGWTPDTLMSAVAPVFDFDTEAGDTRIVFSGNGALNKFNQKVIAQNNAAQIVYKGEVKQWGMQFLEYLVPQGRLLIKTHPLMNRNTLYTNSWFIVDFSAITYVAQKGRDTRMNDNVQAKDEDLQRGYWQTDCSLEVDFGGLTCGYIGGFAT